MTFAISARVYGPQLLLSLAVFALWDGEVSAATSTLKKSKGIVMNHALPWNFLVFDAEKWWRLHFTGAQLLLLVGSRGYFSKLLMGFRLTTKADAACIVTLTQPEMKLHPPRQNFSSNKIFQLLGGQLSKNLFSEELQMCVGGTKSHKILDLKHKHLCRNCKGHWHTYSRRYALVCSKLKEQELKFYFRLFRKFSVSD